MKFLYALLFFYIVLGCSSIIPSTKSDLSSFDNGLQLMYNQDTYKAKKLWGILCREESLELACWANGQTVKPNPALAILQGATDESSTQIAVLVKKNSQLRVYLRNTKDGKLIKEVRRKESYRSHSDMGILQLDYEGLKKGLNYNLVVASAEGKIIDSRILRTLLLESKNLRMAIASCMSDAYAKVQKAQWSDLYKMNPEVILMTGDNVYVDLKLKKLLHGNKVTPKLIWDRHVETRESLEIFRKEKLIPVFAGWDDHDYGLNNAGREFAHKKVAKVVFNEFFPQQINGAVLAKGPGLSQFVRMRNQNFIFFDNRTFRTAPDLKDDQVHFGAQQESWAIGLMKKYKGPFWLISGDQFFGGYHPHESYEGNHPKPFANFLKLLAKTERRYVFVSGDRHLSEIMKIPIQRIGFQTYELTSSGIHATVFPGSFKRWNNPIQIVGVDGTMNYMIVESSAKGRGMRFKVMAYGPEARLLYSKELQVQ